MIEYPLPDAGQTEQAASNDSRHAAASEMSRTAEMIHHLQHPCGLKYEEKLSMLLAYLRLGMSVHDEIKNPYLRGILRQAIESAAGLARILTPACVTSVERDHGPEAAQNLQRVQQEISREVVQWMQSVR